MGSSVSSTPSLDRAVQSDSPDSRDSDDQLVTMSSTQQVVSRKGQHTATPILIYEDTRREVLIWCRHSMTISQWGHCEFLYRSVWGSVALALYITDKANRDTCKHCRAYSREKFVEHLHLLYPQLSKAADKSYLEMIREILFQYDLENQVVELKFQSELSKIVKHYKSLTSSEEAEAVKILMGKINIPTIFN